MKGFLLGVAAGYVLGTRAGRARYEQIVRAYRKIIDHPAVRRAAGSARSKISGKLRQRRQHRSADQWHRRDHVGA